ILPMVARSLPPGGRVLDLGTGEGQVARLAAAGGRQVVGVDPAPAQLREAVRRSAAPSEPARSGSGGGGRPPVYVRAGAGLLPFAGRAFDAAVACLVLEHLPDLDGAVAEVARVLRPGGRFLILCNHPLLQTPGSGWIDDHILEEQYWRIGPYLVEDTTFEEVDKGVLIPFVHRPLSRYVNAMAADGLLLVHMEEPAPPPGFLTRAAEYGQAATIPRLLLLVAEKMATSPGLWRSLRPRCAGGAGS
ncbi:MAG: class I SAM-dependent methyltransferase, partial [Acidimicrobiales bacterium]